MSDNTTATLDGANFESGVDPVSKIFESVADSVSEIDARDRHQKALHHVKNSTILAMTAGMIPIPVADLVAITAIQLRMLQKLTKEYDLKFSKEIVQSLIASLVGGSASTAAGLGLASVLKGVPMIGQAAGVIGTSTMAGFFTYAVGMTFLHHFKSGGDLLSFKPEQMKAYFQSEMERGREVVKRLRSEKLPSRAEQASEIDALTKQVSEMAGKMEAMMAVMSANDSKVGLG